MNKFAEAVGTLVGAVLLGLLICAFFALPVMLLWNWCLVGAVNGVNEIGFWQALGLQVLSWLLIKTNFKKKD